MSSVSVMADRRVGQALWGRWLDGHSSDGMWEESDVPAATCAKCSSAPSDILPATTYFGVYNIAQMRVELWLAIACGLLVGAQATSGACHGKSFRKSTAKLIKEMPFLGLFRDLRNQSVFEGSDIVLVRGQYYVVFDRWVWGEGEDGWERGHRRPPGDGLIIKQSTIPT